MKILKNWLDIALRGMVFVYVPVIMLLYGSYRMVFNMNPGIHWFLILFYLFVFFGLIIDKYRHHTLEEEVQSFDGLDKLIEQGKWKVTDMSQTEMTVRATFDVPFNLIFNDRISLRYANNIVTIEGPKDYITLLAKNIRGEKSLWYRREVSVLKMIFSGLIGGLIGIVPMFTESNLGWNMEVLRHNTFSSALEEVEAVSKDDRGNSLENALNAGQAVETEEYILYIEDHMNLVRTDKHFENKEYLIQRDGEDSLKNLNVVSDWVYFAKGESLERMKVDGSDHSTLYSLSYTSEMQIHGNWIYFLSWKDDFSVYRMDLNGQKLEQLIEVAAYSFSIDDNRLLVSYIKSGQPVVESYDLNGEDPHVVMNAYADNLMIWDGYYYYLGEETGLYRNEIGEDSEPELIMDDHVSSYLPMDQGIFYSVYTRAGIFMMTHGGKDDTLLSASKRVGGIAKVGDSVLFSTEEAYGKTNVKRLDLKSGTIDVLD